MDISVLIPIFNEVDNLPTLLLELREAFKGSGRNFEVIVIDDGSTDGSGLALQKLVGQFSFLKVICFRVNAGQSAAFDAGFRHAQGKVVVTMDGDLQNDPRDILPMVHLVEAGGVDFVSGWRKKRRDHFFKTFPSKIANWIIRRVTRTRLHDMGCSLKAYRKEISDELRLYGEMHRFIAVLAEMSGANVAEYEVHHRPRTAGVSKYGITRTFKVLLDLVSVWFTKSFQTKPIYVFGGVGLMLLALSGLLFGYVLYEKIALDIWVHKNPLFILGVMLSVISVQFIGLGLVAELLVRTYFESQSRTPYRISKKLGFREDSGSSCAA